MSIVSEISKDHQNFRELIQSWKETETLRAKKMALEKISTLLRAHTAAEEKTLYSYARKNKNLKKLAIRSSEELAMAKSLLTKMKRSGARDQWEVQGFLFCEILERHLQFEEQSMLPEADKTLGDSASEQLALKFRKLRPESPGKKTTARNVLSLAVDRETSVPSSSAAS